MYKILCIVLLILFNYVVPIWADEIDLSVYFNKPLAACENNIPCSRLARWQCLAQACDADGNQKPTDCYVTFEADKTRADLAICRAESSSSEENIQSVLTAIPGAKVADILQGLVMMRALKGDGIGCQNRIKEYVGPYGQSWTTFWITAMSGCRILSNQRSVQDEQNDYLVWNEVVLGNKKCSDIQNTEMQMMCNTGVLLGEKI